jgi:type VI secretion system secreted protein VgrG
MKPVASEVFGAGMGSHFHPRIGTEVLIDFLEGDIDRPIILGSLYNGRSEGGEASTPGGATDSASEATRTTDALFAQAHDLAPSAQGNLTGGFSPPWHGASAAAEGHRNAAALSGFKSREFGGNGYNQMVFDDSDQQLRIQLATTQAATQLNLGHLIHQVGNYRGSLRGSGWEARTDAYGAVRGGKGLLFTTYASSASLGNTPDPAGDFTAGQALMRQATTIAENFSKAAQTHQSVALAAHAGSTKAQQSFIDSEASPVAALEKVALGTADAADLSKAAQDADSRITRSGTGRVPHLGAPVVAFLARAGLVLDTGKSLHWSAGETHTQISGGHTVHHTRARHNVHTGQAIGILGGVVKAGENGFGLQMLAAQDPLQLQAQSDELKLLASKEVKLASANGNVTLGAAQEILIRNSAGSYLKISGGNIELRCPGTLTVKAGSKVLSGGGKVDTALPKWPQSAFSRKNRFSFSG